MKEKANQTTSKLENPIDFRIVILIIGIGVGYYIYGTIIPDVEEELDILELGLNGVYLVTATSAFLVARRYWGSEIFGKAYLALGIGFLCVFIGDTTWNYYESVLHIYPFPSIADVFYFGLYPFTLYHLIKNCRYFRENWNKSTKSFLILFPIVIVLIYSTITISEYGLDAIISNEDDSGTSFLYTLIFVGGAANTTTFAILGIMVFRQSTLAAAWALLAGAIFLNDVSDFWYYYLEIFGLWERSHPTMALWFVSNLLVIYALFKHKKIL